MLKCSERPFLNKRKSMQKRRKKWRGEKRQMSRYGEDDKRTEPKRKM